MFEPDKTLKPIMDPEHELPSGLDSARELPFGGKNPVLTKVTGGRIRRLVKFLIIIVIIAALGVVGFYLWQTQGDEISSRMKGTFIADLLGLEESPGGDEAITQDWQDLLDLTGGHEATGTDLNIPGNGDDSMTVEETTDQELTAVAGWSSYEDKEFGLSFKYPPGWQINRDVSAETESLLVVQNEPYRSLLIWKVPVEPDKNLEEFLREKDFLQELISQAVVVAGQPAIEYVNYGMLGDYHEIAFKSGDHVFIFSLADTFDKQDGLLKNFVGTVTLAESEANTMVEEIGESLLDSDTDGLTDSEEKFWGTDPNNSDSDHDSYLDGQEIENGYNPLGEGKISQLLIDSNLVDFFVPGITFNCPEKITGSLSSEEPLAIERNGIKGTDYTVIYECSADFLVTVNMFDAGTKLDLITASGQTNKIYDYAKFVPYRKNKDVYVGELRMPSYVWGSGVFLINVSYTGEEGPEALEIIVDAYIKKYPPEDIGVGSN